MGKFSCVLLAVLLLATVPDQHGIAARPGQIVPPWHHPGPREASGRWNEAGVKEGVWQARRGEASSVGPLVPLMLRLRGGLPESHIYAGDVGDNDAGRASGWRLRLPSAPAFNATEVGQQILSVGEELVTRYGPARGGILGCWTRTSRRQSAGSSSVVPLDAKCKTRLGFPRANPCAFLSSRASGCTCMNAGRLISSVPLSSNRIPSQADVTPGTRALHLFLYIFAGVRGRSSRHTSPMRSPSGTTLTGGSSAWPAAWLQRQCQRT